MVVAAVSPQKDLAGQILSVVNERLQSVLSFRDNLLSLDSLLLF
jgi:hypothetical protein